MQDSYCRNCGNAVQAKDLFCRKCGSPVDSKTVTTKPTQSALHEHKQSSSSTPPLSPAQQQAVDDTKFTTKCAITGGVVLILLDVIIGVSLGGFVITGTYIAGFIGAVLGYIIGMVIVASRKKGRE